LVKSSVKSFHNDVVCPVESQSSQFALCNPEFAVSASTAAPQTAVELRIPRGNRNRLFQRGDGFVQFVLPDEDIGASEAPPGWCLPFATSPSP